MHACLHAGGAEREHQGQSEDELFHSDVFFLFVFCLLDVVSALKVASSEIFSVMRFAPNMNVAQLMHCPS